MKRSRKLPEKWQYSISSLDQDFLPSKRAKVACFSPRSEAAVQTFAQFLSDISSLSVAERQCLQLQVMEWYVVTDSGSSHHPIELD